MVAPGFTKDTHSVGLPLMSDRRGPYMHDILHSQQTNIHATGGIQNHNLTKRAAVDLRFRLCGHRDRRKIKCLV